MGNPKGDASGKWADFNKMTEAWRNRYLSTVTAGQLPFVETAKNVFNLSTMKGPIIISKEVTMSPFEIWTMSSVSKVTGHIKQVHVIAEPKEQDFFNEVVATSMYSDLKPSSSRVKISLWNLTSQEVTIPARCVAGQIQVANEVPGMYAPVTSRGHLISWVAIPNDGNQSSPEPAASEEEDLSQF